jgi:protein-S-isoprenylcysteine O-methyltransferase Ste14
MKSKTLEYTLVLVQVFTAAYLVIKAPWMSMQSWSIIIVALSGCLAIWSILTMQLNNLRITPTPGENARLVTSGPYRLIRHPMYSSLILLALPLVLAEFNTIKLAMGLILVFDLLIKLNYEEKLLKLKFPQYMHYRQTTYRLIPFIY